MIHPSRAPKMWLIDGVFFQIPSAINVDFPSGHPAAATPDERFPFMYAGFLGRDATCVLDTMSGALLDDFGASTLHEVVLNEEEGKLEFTKCYVDTTAPIFYRFARREDGLWVGRYSGEDVEGGGGYTHCLIRLAPPGFFRWPT